MALIHAQEATVRTATVEIRALTVSGKQVTLALYRQLPEDNCFDIDRDVLKGPWGPIWGWVNHCPDRRCATWAHHRHFIWQNRDELCRDYIEVSRCAEYRDLSQEYRQCMDRIWDLVCQSPQLFIAV